MATLSQPDIRAAPTRTVAVSACPKRDHPDLLAEVAADHRTVREAACNAGIGKFSRVNSNHKLKRDCILA